MRASACGSVCHEVPRCACVRACVGATRYEAGVADPRQAVHSVMILVDKYTQQPEHGAHPRVGARAAHAAAEAVVEQAAQRQGLVSSAVEFAASSAAHHAGLRSDALMAAMPADSAYWRLGNTPFERDAAYRRLLELPMRAADVQRIETTLLKGWALGSCAFLANIGAFAGRRPSPKPRGRPPLGRQPA